MTVFTSAIATIGRNRQKSRNIVKNKPKLPASMPRSTQVVTNMPHLLGRKLRCSDVRMMTKRSNHMPMFTHIATNITAARLLRSFLLHSSCGATTLQKVMMHHAHWYGPSVRLRKWKRSNCESLYHVV